MIFKHFQLIFFQFLVIKTLDPDPDSLNPDRDTTLQNEYYDVVVQSSSNIKKEKISFDGVVH
jgi:hypothetical protein